MGAFKLTSEPVTDASPSKGMIRDMVPCQKVKLLVVFCHLESAGSIDNTEIEVIVESSEAMVEFACHMTGAMVKCLVASVFDMEYGECSILIGPDEERSKLIPLDSPLEAVLNPKAEHNTIFIKKMSRHE